MPEPGVRPLRRGPLRPRIELLLASFAPLFAVLAWRLADRLAWLLVFGALAATGAGVVGYLLLATRTQAGDPITFEDITDLGDQVAGHVMGYLIPFLIPRDAAGEEVALTLATLLLLATILVQSNRVHLNPLFYLFGFRIYSATVGTRSYYLIARSELARHHGPLLVAEVEAGIVIEKRGKK